MILETKYNIGDKVFAAFEIVFNNPLTIGKIEKSIIDSPGIPGETLFDNYKPQKQEEEKYMCIETGIGSGSVYPVEELFTTSEAAEKRFRDKLAKDN